jgi:hypothetical protein
MTFLLPAGVALVAVMLAWGHATTTHNRWVVLHMQPWEDGATEAPLRTTGFDEQSGGRVNRTREVALLWRDFALWGIVLSLALFSAAIFNFGGEQPSPLASGLLFAGYAFTGVLLIGRSALLRLATEWRLDRLPIAGSVGSSWVPTTATLAVAAGAVIGLLLVAHVLDLVHVVLAAAWNGFLGPLLLALAYFLAHNFGGTNQQQFNSAMKNFGAMGRPAQPRFGHAPASHSAFPWVEVLTVAGVIVALLLLRAYLRYRKEREPGAPWWRIFPAMWAELRAVLRALLTPTRALAAHLAVRAGASAASIEARRRRRARRPGDMGPRELIAYLYEQALEAAARWGHPRRTGQTPGEYAAELGKHLGSSGDAFEDLTATFVEARYSPHEVRQDLVGRAQAGWQALREGIRQARRQKRT